MQKGRRQPEPDQSGLVGARTGPLHGQCRRLSGGASNQLQLPRTAPGTVVWERLERARIVSLSLQCRIAALSFVRHETSTRLKMLYQGRERRTVPPCTRILFLITLRALVERPGDSDISSRPQRCSVVALWLRVREAAAMAEVLVGGPRTC